MIKRISQWLALNITRAVGTMAMAGAFTCLALISLPAAIHTHDKIVIVAWIAQTFFQLVLLPVIMVGQRIQAEKTIKHVTKNHDEHMAHLTKIHKKLGIK